MNTIQGDCFDTVHDDLHDPSPLAAITIIIIIVVVIAITTSTDIVILPSGAAGSLSPRLAAWAEVLLSSLVEDCVISESGFQKKKKDSQNLQIPVFSFFAIHTHHTTRARWQLSELIKTTHGGGCCRAVVCL